eukprot:scaffold305_cov247-Pinguiococcus_pyrenoidosus.AAC.13
MVAGVWRRMSGRPSTILGSSPRAGSACALLACSATATCSATSRCGPLTRLWSSRSRPAWKKRASRRTFARTSTRSSRSGGTSKYFHRAGSSRQGPTSAGRRHQLTPSASFPHSKVLKSMPNKLEDK